MKKVFVSLFALIMMFGVHAQIKFAPLDKSPMDMSYYPTNYPILKIQDKATEPLVARVIYGRPQRDGRNIFGELEPYGKVWRMGANEATEIEFYKNVVIGNTKVKQGRYTLYAMINADTWTMIINKETDVWGAFKYDSTKDVARLEVPVQKQTELTEIFSIAFEKNADKSAVMVIAWDNALVRFPFSW